MLEAAARHRRDGAYDAALRALRQATTHQPHNPWAARTRGSNPHSGSYAVAVAYLSVPGLML